MSSRLPQPAARWRDVHSNARAQQGSGAYGTQWLLKSIMNPTSKLSLHLRTADLQTTLATGIFANLDGAELVDGRIAQALSKQGGGVLSPNAVLLKDHVVKSFKSCWNYWLLPYYHRPSAAQARHSFNESLDLPILPLAEHTVVCKQMCQAENRSVAHAQENSFRG